VDDLLEVSGIGPARLALLKPLVTIGSIGPGSADRAGPDFPGEEGSETAVQAGPDSIRPAGSAATPTGGKMR
jgi:hypothetical protein